MKLDPVPFSATDYLLEELRQELDGIYLNAFYRELCREPQIIDVTQPWDDYRRYVIL